MRSRYLSLYLSSIDARRSVLLFWAWLAAPFGSSAKRRESLSRAVQSSLGNVDVFAYGSARGALAACLRAAGVGSGDVVLLSSFTCLAVPTAVLAIGARPEYVDIDAASLNTPIEKVAAALHSGVRAIVVQHTLGSFADVESIAAIARQRGVLVIEDCALSIGSMRNERPIGTTADAAIFSMEVSKLISSGWGGILVSKDPALSKRVSSDYLRLSEPPMSNTARRVLQAAISGACYVPLLFPIGRYVVALGFRLGVFKGSTPAAENEGIVDRNFISKLSGTQAVLATAQWQRLAQIALLCAEHGRRLRTSLRAAGFSVVAESNSRDISVTPRVPFLVADRAAATQWFASRNVELGAWFDGPLSPLPESDRFGYEPAKYPNAVAVAKRIVNLPSHCGLTNTDVDRLIVLIERFASEQSVQSQVLANSKVKYESGAH